ncbi:MAG: metallophosphoesterase, partial [Candidatus Hodarchaeales archaeon]
MVFTEISLVDKAVVIADLHLEQKKITITRGGRKFSTSKRKLVKSMLEYLSEATMIIFNGDTAELRWAHARGEVQDNSLPAGFVELEWLVQTLDDLGLLDKSVFIRGNHDYNIDQFSSTGKILVRDYCRIPCGDTFALVTHG